MQQLQNKGFLILENVFTSEEVAQITNKITQVIIQADSSRPAFRKTGDLFAIRKFLKEIPEIHDLIFTDTLKSIITNHFDPDYFVIKSIYFDKPAQSNWFVAWHQDLTISVDRKIDLPDFSSWTVKQDQFAVQPPLNILESIFTIRIHLDDTDEQNGALKVIPGSHLKGIYRPESIDWSTEQEEICKIQKGGIMIMRPLLLHASNRTTNNHKRRVIHIEFSNQSLPGNLEWAEFSNC